MMPSALGRSSPFTYFLFPLFAPLLFEFFASESIINACFALISR